MEIDVELGSWDIGETALTRMAFDPSRFWPELDEAPFPDDPDVQVVVSAVSAPDFEDALSASYRLRTEELPDDPWMALVVFQAERACAFADYHRDVAAWRARHGLPTRDEVDTREYRRLSDAIEEPEPDVELGVLIDLATVAIDRWGPRRHEIVDYARMYLLDALRTTRGGDRESTEIVLDILASSQDEVVRSEAVGSLASAGVRASLEPAELDALRSVYDTDDVVMDRMRHQLAVLGVETSLDHRDLRRADEWMRLHQASTEAYCEPGHHPDWCETFRAQRDARSGYLAALGGLPPTTWQAALVSSVQGCYFDGMEPVQTVTGRSRWIDGWTWEAWTDGSAFTLCVEAAAAGEPPPPEGARVVLRVRPPPGDSPHSRE